VGLGSNLADPCEQVRRALAELGQIEQTRCVASSALYRSAPMGPPDQPDYINAVAWLSTGLDAYGLLEALQSIEQRFGRVRTTQRWGPRTLDLDLLVFGKQVLEDPHLTVPHPGIVERAFVLYPLYEIAPDLQIPGHGPVATLLSACPRGALQGIELGPGP
jgi:2-amino-4-hydroxy-6-hydroxymethyldihydropteridine diphosphokinase